MSASQAFLADRARAIKPSPSMAAKARVDQLRAQGRDIVDFTVGEPDLPTPAHIVRAGMEALRGGDIRYTASVGSRPLLEAIRLKFQRENGLDFGLDELIVGAGAKQLIHTALSATVQAGDEVIISAPYWVSYPDMVLVNDGTPVTVPCPEVDGFKLTPQALERAITPRSKWLLLNTPGNPAGAMYDADELRALARVLDRHPHVWLMTDEIYEHLAYGGARRVSPVAAAPSLADRALVINGVSKSYAMTGWRLGYAAGPKMLIQAMAALISQSTSCVSAVSQAAARVALTADQGLRGRDGAALRRTPRSHRGPAQCRAGAALPGAARRVLCLSCGRRSAGKARAGWARAGQRPGCGHVSARRSGRGRVGWLGLWPVALPAVELRHVHGADRRRLPSHT